MFENEVVKLRKLSLDDYTTYHNWRNDLDVMYSTSPLLDVYTLEETEDFIKQILASSNSKSYIIEYKETNIDVGITSLVNIDHKNQSAEFIIDIGEKDMWGKGIASNTIPLILEYAFNELNLHRIFLRVFSFNENAVKLYEKIGFVHEGKLREAFYRNGKWHDIVMMSILRNEYNNIK